MKILNPAKIFQGLQEKKLQKKESTALFRESVVFLFNKKNKQEQKALTEALKKEGITAPIFAALSESVAQNVHLCIRREIRVMRGYHANTLNLVKGTTYFSKILVIIRDLCNFKDVSDISSEDALTIIIEVGILQSTP